MASSPDRGAGASGWVRRGRGVATGLITAFAAIGVAQLVAGFTRPQFAPVVAVGGAAIDNTPPPVKNFAISAFGSNDKRVLVAGILVVLAVFAALIGIAALHRLAFGLAGLAVFTAIGLLAALTRPDSGAIDALPLLLGGAAGAYTMSRLVQAASTTERALSAPPPATVGLPPGSPDWAQTASRPPGATVLASRSGRRAFLITGSVAVGIAGASALIGQRLARPLAETGAGPEVSKRYPWVSDWVSGQWQTTYDTGNPSVAGAGNYVIQSDTWNWPTGYLVSQRTFAASQNAFGCVCAVNDGGGVSTYPSCYIIFTDPPPLVSAIPHLYATFVQSMPQTGVTSEAAFDIWIVAQATPRIRAAEVMIFVENHGTSPGTVIASNQSISGLSWRVGTFDGSPGPPGYVFSLAGAQYPNGTLDLMPFMTWLVANNAYFASIANPAVKDLEFGWEVLSTGGEQRLWICRQYSLSYT